MKTLKKLERDELSSMDALQRLIDGNLRFTIKDYQCDTNFKEQISDTAEGQFPFAVVLSCIDSRVPSEIIFDQGIGNIFNIRVAGNVISNDVLGSMEFACKLAGAKLVVVLGHTRCGAVRGACNNAKLGNLTELLEKIKPAVESVRNEDFESNKSDNPEVLEKVAKKNVENVIENILNESEIINEMIQNQEINIVGAMYYVESGKVVFNQ